VNPKRTTRPEAAASSRLTRKKGRLRRHSLARHESALAKLADTFGTVSASTELLAFWRSQRSDPT
jgi:hypothetical protein